MKDPYLSLIILFSVKPFDWFMQCCIRSFMEIYL